MIDHDTKRQRSFDGEIIFSDNRYKLNGFGRYTDEEMHSLGCFKDHKLNGYGKVIHPEGTIDEGKFKNHKLNGKGKIVYSDGTVEQGHFLNRRLQGNDMLFDHTIVSTMTSEEPDAPSI